MTEMQADSFDVPAIGWQNNSQKETLPSYSFGTGVRTAANKVYMSKTHEKRKAISNSPGPVYGVPSSVGQGPRFGFGTEEQRYHPKAQYPDSSVDLTCAIVDTQAVKFHGTKAVHFGTETRMNHANAEPLQHNTTSMLCSQSPAAFDYEPDDSLVTKQQEKYSFGPKEAKLGEKCPPRLQLPLTGTPRHVGPGSHMQPGGCGSQPSSARKSAPSWSFGGKRTSSAGRSRMNNLIDPSPELSSLGKQVVSNQRSAPSCGFGTSTRDHSARTFLVVTNDDRGPAATMAKPVFHLEMPAPAKNIARPGM